MAAATESEPASDGALPQIKRLRVCLLGDTTFATGMGKSDIASALLRGLTADRPGAADPVLDLAYDHGVFERAWWELLSEPKGPPPEVNEETGEETPEVNFDRWGAGPLSDWDTEGRLRYASREIGMGIGGATPPYDADPDENCASLCAGSPDKWHLGNKRSPGVLRLFRDTLVEAGQDISAVESLQKELYEAAEKQPRELVRKDRPCQGVLASFARFSPEVGDLKGCGTAILHVFEPGMRPEGSKSNVAMLYAAAPNSLMHRGHGQSPGTFLCALRAIASNVVRLVNEYNRVAAGQPKAEAWERALWWQADLRAQVEYYFSDRNLRGDYFFSEKILADIDGWVDMEGVRSCPRIESSNVAVNEELLDALSSSKTVETKTGDEGKAFVRRLGGKPFAMGNDGMYGKRKYGKAFGGEGGGRRERDTDMTCWDFVRKGHCPRGDQCRYEHKVTPESEAAAANRAAVAANQLPDGGQTQAPEGQPNGAEAAAPGGGEEATEAPAPAPAAAAPDGAASGVSEAAAALASVIGDVAST